MNKFLRNRTAILIFTLPTLILFTIIVFYPITQTFYRSFFDWNGLSDGKFILFDNYIRLFQDDLFYTSLKNGIIFAAILVVFQIGIATLLALVVSDQTVFGRKFLRITYFIPVVLSVTVVCQLWLSIYNSEYGLLNRLFSELGIGYMQDWLSNEKTAIIAIAVVNAWHFMGYQFSLLYAAIRSIPEHYYEAARIDGAGKLRAHLAITIPLLSETYRFCLVLAVTGGLNAFSQMFIMTGGGPGNATYTLTYMMYRSAFRVNEYGYGSTAAAFLVIECLLATVIINRLVAREKITY